MRDRIKLTETELEDYETKKAEYLKGHSMTGQEVEERLQELRKILEVNRHELKSRVTDLEVAVALDHDLRATERQLREKSNVTMRVAVTALIVSLVALGVVIWG